MRGAYVFGRRSAAIVGSIMALFAGEDGARGQCTEGCTAIHTWVGEAAGTQFGWVSDDVGDIDMDGVHDLVITAPFHAGGGTNAGRVYVYSGRTGAPLHVFTGNIVNGQMGYSVDGAGDVNMDGTPDVIVGIPFAAAGSFRVYSGADGSLLYDISGQASNDRMGYAVSAAGDINMDGYADFLAGAILHDSAALNAGRAYLYSGIDGSLIATMDGFGATNRFGSSADHIGDVDGDEVEDIVVGAFGAGGGGLAYVFSGAMLLGPDCPGANCLPLYTLDPGIPAAVFGQWFIDGLGDVNADGTPDIYVGDYVASRGHIFSGVDGSRIWTFLGDGDGQFGIGRGAGDVDNDGHADVLLCAWASSAGAPNAGKGFVYSGRDGSVFETFTHNIAGAGFGFDANGMLDVNGDGMHDFLITAASDAGSRGTSYLIAGTTPRATGGDLDLNGTVELNDFATFAVCFGGTGVTEPPPGCSWADFYKADTNDDGSVDLTDFATFATNYTG